MAWILLLIAGLFEIVWAVGLKFTDGFQDILPSILVLLAMVISFWVLAIAIRKIPVGTAYAVWTGIGAVGTGIIGMVFLGDPAALARIVCLGAIILGVVGLKLFARH